MALNIPVMTAFHMVCRVPDGKSLENLIVDGR